jgi:16S rRNA (cytosine1402-N4)-methyltransferase
VSDIQFLHTPVLLQEVLSQLDHCVTYLSSTPHLVPVFRIVDCTLGGAGHAVAILKRLFEQLPSEISIEYYGFDQDPEAHKAAASRIMALATESSRPFRFTPLQTNFTNFAQFLENLEPDQKINFLLADFGVSSPQLDHAHRGFSLQQQGPLDMRMDPNNPIDCLHLLTHLTENELFVLFRDLGEEPRAKKLARALIQDRGKSDLHLSNTLEFAQYVQRVLGYHGSRVHPATRIFQALRMAVNKETDAIENLLKYVPLALAPGGLACFISFHSLEDRLVKQSFRAWQDGQNLAENLRAKKNFTPLLPWENKKSWGKESPRGGETPTETEVKFNPRSRSARLRTFQFNLELRS